MEASFGIHAETCDAWYADQLSTPAPKDEPLRVLNVRAGEPLTSPFNLRMGVDGFGVLSAMRSGGKRTPVLMLTTESADAKKQQGKAAGVSAWLTKPFQPARLVLAANSICRA